MGRALDVDAARRVDLARFVPIAGSSPRYLWAETSDADAFESAVRDAPAVADVETLDGTAGRTLCRISWADSDGGLFEALASHDLVVHRAGTADGEWLFKLVAATRAPFVEFQADCKRRGIPLTIRRLTDADDLGSALYGVTEKQREALLLAYDSGYYDAGTSVQLGELSEGLQISQQSFSARLKRGIHALVGSTIAIDEYS